MCETTDNAKLTVHISNMMFTSHVNHHCVQYNLTGIDVVINHQFALLLLLKVELST